MLKKVPLAGGPPVSLCATPAEGGGSWTGDDTIVFGSEYSGLSSVPAVGGNPEPLTELGPDEVTPSDRRSQPGCLSDQVVASTSEGWDWGRAACARLLKGQQHQDLPETVLERLQRFPKYRPRPMECRLAYLHSCGPHRVPRRRAGDEEIAGHDGAIARVGLDANPAALRDQDSALPRFPQGQTWLGRHGSRNPCIVRRG